MSVSPLPVRTARLGAAPTVRRLVGTPPVRPAPTPGRIWRRRLVIGVTKRLLPVGALALLVSVALWPELSGDNDRARFSYRRGGVEMDNGEIIDARYRGIDDRNRPYTFTAATAHQVSATRINMTEPKGDIVLENGAWLMVQAHQGVFLQHINKLDLSGNVTLYRDDGTTMQTAAASLDLKAGVAAGAELTHVEGPFGTLDAQGFALTDKGAVIQFTGPGRLVMNQRAH